MKNNSKNNGKNRGYTLLFAVLVSSLVLSVGISILTISKKEFLLAASARESTLALYAADSGLECAVYHDTYGSKFFGIVGGDGQNIGNVKCAGFTVQNVDVFSVPNQVSFDVKLFDTSCASVKVINLYPLDPVKVGISIESSGYNTGWDSVLMKCNVPSPRRVERALYYTTSNI